MLSHVFTNINSGVGYVIIVIDTANGCPCILLGIFIYTPNHRYIQMFYAKIFAYMNLDLSDFFTFKVITLQNNTGNTEVFL